MYTIMGIRNIGRSVRKLDHAAKFIPWFDECGLGGPDDNDVDDILGDPDYVPAL